MNPLWNDDRMDTGEAGVMFFNVNTQKWCVKLLLRLKLYLCYNMFFIQGVWTVS